MTKNPVEQFTSEFEINDAPLSARNLLTRGHIQDEITQISGCAVTTRGRYMNPVERLKNNNERALYLYIQGPNKASVDIAIQKIDEIIRTEQINTNNGNNGSTMKQYRNNNTHYAVNPPSVTSVEKVYVGIENVSPGFDLRGKLIGVRGTNLNYIRNETGAIVTLRGKGSLFIDPNLGTESSEPLHLYIEHSKYEGLTVAKQLALNLIETLQQEVAQSQPQVVIQPQTQQLQIYSNNPQIYPPQSTSGIINFKPNAPPPQLNIPPPGVHIPSQQGPLITATNPQQNSTPITLLNTEMSGGGVNNQHNMIITNTGGQLMSTPVSSHQSSMIYNQSNNNPYHTLQFQIPTSTQSTGTTLRPQFNNSGGTTSIFDHQTSHIEHSYQHHQQNSTTVQQQPSHQQSNQLITQLIPTQHIQGVPQQQQHHHHHHQQTMQIIGNGSAGAPGTVVTVPMHSQFQIQQQPGTTTTQLQVNPQTGQLQQINTTMIPTSSHQVAFQIPIQQQNGGQYLQQQSVLLQHHPNQTQQIQLQTNPSHQVHQIPILPQQQTTMQPAGLNTQQQQQYMTAQTAAAAAAAAAATQQGHQIYATQQGLVLLQQNQNLQITGTTNTVQQQSISNYTATIQQQDATQIPVVTANTAPQQIQMNLPPPLNQQQQQQQSTTINCIQSHQQQQGQIDPQKASADHLLLEQMVQQQQQQQTVAANQQQNQIQANLNHHLEQQINLQQQRCVVSQQQHGNPILQNPTAQLTLTTTTTDQSNQTATLGGNNQLQLLQQQQQQQIICDQTTNQQQNLQASNTNLQQAGQQNSIQFINQNLQQIQPDLQNKNIQQQSYLFMQQPTIQTNNPLQEHHGNGNNGGGGGGGAGQEQHQITFIGQDGQQLQLQQQPFTSTSFPISIQQVPPVSTTTMVMGSGNNNMGLSTHETNQELLIDNTTTTVGIIQQHSIVSQDNMATVTPIQTTTSGAAPSSVMKEEPQQMIMNQTTSSGKKRKLSETDSTGGMMGDGGGATGNGGIKNNATSTELSPAGKKSGVGIDQIQTGKAVLPPNNYNQQKGALTQNSTNTCTTSSAGNQKSMEKEKSPQQNQDVFQRNSQQQWQPQPSTPGGGNRLPSNDNKPPGGGMIMQQEKWQQQQQQQCGGGQQWISTTVTTTQDSIRNSIANNNRMTIPPQVQQIRPNFNPTTHQQKYQQYLSGNQPNPVASAYNIKQNNQHLAREQQARIHYNNQMNSMQQIAPARTSPYPPPNNSSSGGGNNNLGNSNPQHYLQTMNSRSQQQANWQQQQQQQTGQFNPTQSGGWM